MEFLTNYSNRPKPFKGEVNSGEVKVESTGILKPEVEIERYARAGRNLMVHRQDQYDFEESAKIDGVSPDFTRKPGYDLAENSMMLKELKAPYMRHLASKIKQKKLDKLVKEGKLVKNEKGEYVSPPEKDPPVLPPPT